MQIEPRPHHSSDSNAPSGPSASYRWMMYGAYGYTGELLARQAVAAGARPILAGRNREALARLGAELDLPFVALELDDREALEAALRDVELVVHCAGPFAETSAVMVDACCATSTHYLDITGEYAVIDRVLKRDADARAAGIALLPACGWDVVPSDCLIATVAQHVEQPHTAELVMRTRGSMSRGTARTVASSVGAPAMCRHGGVFRPVPAKRRTMHADLPFGPTRAAAISWGDIASASYSVGVSDTYTYAAMPRLASGGMRAMEVLGRAGVVRSMMRAAASRVADRATGSDAGARGRARCELWARVTGADGRAATGSMVTPDGYVLTADAALRITGLVQAGRIAPGAATPSMACGADFAATLPGVELRDIRVWNA